MVWHGPAPELLAQPRQTLPGCPGQASGSPASSTEVQVWDKGTLSAWLSQPNPCHPHHAKQGALLCCHRGMQGPPTFPLSPGTRWQKLCGRQRHGGTGTPGHWGSSVPESLVILGTLDVGAPGGAKDTQLSLFCYQGCQGSHGSSPTPVCTHTRGAGVPGTLAPGMLKVLGGPGGFGRSESFQRSCGSWGSLCESGRSWGHGVWRSLWRCLGSLRLPGPRGTGGAGGHCDSEVPSAPMVPVTLRSQMSWVSQGSL